MACKRPANAIKNLAAVARPSRGVLEHSGILDEEAVKRLEKQWEEKWKMNEAVSRGFEAIHIALRTRFLMNYTTIERIYGSVAADFGTGECWSPADVEAICWGMAALGLRMGKEGE